MTPPILMSGAMVRAVLREIERPGTGKTQTRRIIKPRGSAPSLFDGTWTDDYVLDPGNAEWRAQDVRFFPGQLLWVRESFHGNNSAEPWTIYRADGDNSDIRWTPSIHMPRWASRLTLEVTGVKVERLNSISEEDAKAEGIEHDSDGWRDYLMPHTQCCAGPVDSFRTLWASINGPGSWEANPFVVAVSFTPRLKNIDQFETRKDAQR